MISSTYSQYAGSPKIMGGMGRRSVRPTVLENLSSDFCALAGTLWAEPRLQDCGRAPLRVAAKLWTGLAMGWWFRMLFLRV